MTLQKSILDLSYIPIQISNSSNCPYIDSKIETRAFINLSDYPESHDQLAEIGFRRVENWAYKPICHNCNQCIPLRISCKKFKPNQNQRRCISKKLIKNILPCLDRKEHFQIFKKYQKERHKNGLMSKMTWDNYSNMINLTPINSMVFEYKNSENKLIARIRKCLTKFSRHFDFGAVQKYVNLVDLVKSFQTSISYLLSKIGFDTADNGPLKVCQKS